METFHQNQKENQKLTLQKNQPPEKCQPSKPSNLPETLFTLNSILQSYDAEAKCDIQQKNSAQLKNYTNLSFQNRVQSQLQWLSDAKLNETTIAALQVI